MKKEGSTTASITGVQEPAFPIVKRKMKVDEEASMFENLVINSLLNDKDLKEAVKKKGNRWVVIDPETDTSKGSYQTREDALEAQKKMKKQQSTGGKKSSSGSSKPKTAPKAHTAPKAKEAPGAKVSKVKKEQFLKNLKDNFKSLVSEGSMISYVFEQSPVSEDSTFWDSFLQRLSRQTILSDPKLKTILHEMAQAEVKLLSSSLEQIKKVLQGTGAFEVEKAGVDQDETGGIMLNFLVTMKQTGDQLLFAVKIENKKPIVFFPEDTRNTLNMLADDNSKLLRAELMHTQETVLDKITDLYDQTVKRDEYLKDLAVQVEEVLRSMDGLKIAILRHLLKSNYREVR